MRFTHLTDDLLLRSYTDPFSRRSHWLANQSHVPLWLWDSSLNKSSQGFTQAKENTAKHLKTGSWIMDDMLGYIRHKNQFRSLLHIMAGAGEQEGSCTLVLDKQNSAGCVPLSNQGYQGNLCPLQTKSSWWHYILQDQDPTNTLCWRCK